MLREVTRQCGAVLAPLHYGSFFLTGGAIFHQLNLRCTAIVTHNNMLVIPAEQAAMWRRIHHRTERLQQQVLFRAGVTPVQDIERYLSKPHCLLWAMMDVREAGRERPEFPFEFQQRQIYLQTGAARLASQTGRPFVPIHIKYNRSEKLHHLHFGSPISSNNSPVEMTQQALTQLEKHLDDQPQQFFHDMNYFSVPAKPPMFDKLI
jgi:lauroyl/myristoyl acyltransferase